jgi:hypothetical protein
MREAFDEAAAVSLTEALKPSPSLLLSGKVSPTCDVLVHRYQGMALASKNQ